MTLKGKKIGILIEGDYYEPEIWYYKHRFAEEDGRGWMGRLMPLRDALLRGDIAGVGVR